jgi:membrane-associated phospholipid phosphatase
VVGWSRGGLLSFRRTLPGKPITTPAPDARRHRLRLITLACAVGFLLVVLSVTLGYDDNLERAWILAIGNLRGPILTHVMEGFTWFGNGAVEPIFVMLVVGALVWQGRRRAGSWYFGWTLGGWALYALLKLAFERPRPHIIEKLTGGGWWSFPSGHAMMGPIIFVAAVATLTEDARWARLRTPGLVLAWLLCLGLAASRVYLGVHYVSDVVAGLLVGSAWMTYSLSRSSE